jgi:hypothetical protein
MNRGKLNQEKEGILDQTENIRVVILENLLHQQKLNCHKIVKLSSSTENTKLETLYSPNKGSP